MNVIYLIHFDTPLAGHAEHYLGSSENWQKRLHDHATGQGARITQVLYEIGCNWKLAATFLLRDDAPLTLRQAERLAKSRHSAQQFCPICCKGNHTSPRWTVETPCPQITSTEFRHERYQHPHRDRRTVL